MTGLRIEEVENGFVVYEDTFERAVVGKKWCFETATALAEFMKIWGTRRVEIKAESHTQDAVAGT